MSFAITKRVVYGGGITHCLKSNFTSVNEINLIVSKSSLLQVFTLRLDGHSRPMSGRRKLSSLCLVYETYLFGNVQAMGAVRLPGHNTDALILCFEDWKVSIVEWDVSKHDLVIISLHNFDKDSFLKEGPSQFVVPTKVVIDYKGRCSCILICDEYLAVIPFIDTRHGSNKATKIPEEKLLRRRAQAQSSFIVKLPESGIRNIRDVKFLHGYYEPALMILYEPTGTWVGRLAYLSQSVSISIITLDLARQQSMVVWSVSHLPHDCYCVCPLLYPGGACILSSSAILYIDHSSRYKLVLNKFGLEDSSDVNGKFIVEESELTLTLDNACYTFLNDNTLLLADENSDYFILQLICDSRTVIRMTLLHAFRAPHPNCLITLSDTHVFTASKISDSLLFSYKAIPLDHDSSALETRNISQSDPTLHPLLPPHNNDDIFDPHISALVSLMQSSKSTTKGQCFQWKFKIQETLPSFAPFVDFHLRNVPHSPDRAIEFLTISGYDLNGAITLIHDGSRNTRSSFQYTPSNNVEAIWTLLPPPYNPKKRSLSNRHYSNGQKKSNCVDSDLNHLNSTNLNHSSDFSAPTHKYLLLAGKDDSTVLEFNDDSLNRREDIGEQISQVTINAGCMGNRYNLIVHDYDVVSCEGLAIIDQYQVEETDVYITWSDIKEPYVVLMLSNDSVVVLEVNRMGRLDLVLDLAVSLSSVALFRDRSSVLGFNILTEEAKEKYKESEEEVDSWSQLDDEEDQERAIDPVELIIYGSKTTAPRKQIKQLNWVGKAFSDEELIKPYYLLFVLKDGTLEIHKICSNDFGRGTPISCDNRFTNSYRIVSKSDRVGLTCVFRSFGLSNGRNRLEFDEDTANYLKFHEESTFCHSIPNVLEIKMEHCGSPQNLPFLIACLDNGNIYAYLSYFYVDPLAPDQILPIRFSRIPLPTICANLQENPTPTHLADPLKPTFISRQTREWDHARIHYFDNINEKEGFFITGELPLWLFCERDTLRLQRMRGEGYVFAWSHINTSICKNGYVYCCKFPNPIMTPTSSHVESKSVLRFCNLDEKFQCDISNGACSFRRIPLRETPHSIAYDVKSGSTLVLASKRYVDWKKYAIGAFDDTKEAQRQIDEETGVYEKVVSELDTRLPPVYDEACSIRVFDADWNEGEGFSLLPEEWGICKFLPLDFFSDHGNKIRTNFLVLGTSLARGEDAICKGRIFIFDLYKNRLLLKCAKGRKNPIAVIEAINGSLITSEGRQLYLYQVRAKEGLYPIAFFDAQLATISLTVFKNYVLFGDIHKSIHFLRWINSIKTLQLLGKDCNHLHVLATSIILIQNRLTLVLVDDVGNLYLFAFDPKNPKSIDGSRLICLGDIHYGTTVRKMEKYAARTVETEPSHLSVGSQNGTFKPSHSKNSMGHDNTPKNPSPVTIGSYITGLDGSLGYLYPIPKEVFDILKKLEARLADQLEYITGLHPYAARVTRPRYKLNHSRIRSILDGELLWKFVHLEYTKQEQLASSVGARSSIEILDYLMQFHVYSGFIL